MFLCLWFKSASPRWMDTWGFPSFPGSAPRGKPVTSPWEERDGQLTAQGNGWIQGWATMFPRGFLDGVRFRCEGCVAFVFSFVPVFVFFLVGRGGVPQLKWFEVVVFILDSFSGHILLCSGPIQCLGRGPGCRASPAVSFSPLHSPRVVTLPGAGGVGRCRPLFL